MSKGNLSVRFSKEQRARLEELARKTNVDVAFLVRLGTDAILEYAEKHGGRIVLPLNFDESVEIKPKPKKGRGGGAHLSPPMQAEHRAIA